MLALDLRVRQEPGRVVVTGRVTRDGTAVPIDWPVIIVGREGHLTAAAVHDAIRHLAGGD